MIKKIFLLTIILMEIFPMTNRANDTVLVNGIPVSQEQLNQLQQIVGPVAPGDYWYDNISGLWGYKGRPYSGQILPGLNLGGPLQPDASGNGTGVFINGREIHPLELAKLQQSFGAINPGRYWLNAQGIGGYEGGPAQFNLALAAGRWRKYRERRRARLQCQHRGRKFGQRRQLQLCHASRRKQHHVGQLLT